MNLQYQPWTNNSAAIIRPLPSLHTEAATFSAKSSNRMNMADVSRTILAKRVKATTECLIQGRVAHAPDTSWISRNHFHPLRFASKTGPDDSHALQNRWREFGEKLRRRPSALSRLPYLQYCPRSCGGSNNYVCEVGSASYLSSPTTEDLRA